MSFILVAAAGVLMGAAFNVYFMTGVNVLVLAAFFLASAKATLAARLFGAAMAVVCLQGGFVAGMMLQLNPFAQAAGSTRKVKGANQMSAQD